MSALCWLRRDLRLHDHRALFEATRQHKEVFLVFVFDSKILGALPSKEDKRVSLIWDLLGLLKGSLNPSMVILYGDPTVSIPKLAKDLDVKAVFTNEDYEPYAKKRDRAIKKSLGEQGIAFHSFKDQVVFSGTEILKDDGTPYKVFTPYKKAWWAKFHALRGEPAKRFTPQLQNIGKVPAKFKSVRSLKEIGFQHVDHGLELPPDLMRGFSKWLSSHLEVLPNYQQKRDFPASSGTSRLSPFLRFGMVSVRELVRMCQEPKWQNSGSLVFISELIWRDFYQMILDQNPNVSKEAFLEKYRKIKWPGKRAHFELWKQGRTGFPIVDAGMRELKATGLMHNRVRMITASFLVKDLHIDWKWGEKYFADELLDFDLATNNGGWQWCASVGCDPQPYFRVFNPGLQAKRFDPEMAYIRRWVPEFGTARYPKPIVDHSKQAREAVKLFRNQ